MSSSRKYPKFSDLQQTDKTGTINGKEKKLRTDGKTLFYQHGSTNASRPFVSGSKPKSGSKSKGYDVATNVKGVRRTCKGEYRNKCLQLSSGKLKCKREYVKKNSKEEMRQCKRVNLGKVYANDKPKPKSKSSRMVYCDARYGKEVQKECQRLRARERYEERKALGLIKKRDRSAGPKGPKPGTCSKKLMSLAEVAECRKAKARASAARRRAAQKA